ncbi:centrosomal protein of 70 kDa isoform X2 [Electrophorus electricus]|uniref:Centrosomal protein of 70 kDa n=1 Tax=Electrophorus electricus TaxID=8005 RepID=A0A4W4H5S3_ELEEL|nr:centrosomal protein of 70 kDa isoform X2 [Electrophorus electricus]XP_026883511.2 centrosomal protein of 70 kDa isoform X2 [Electrophorus electricus]XP_035376792.1 centrosomal protein of 70 kDa isoform X2 [Electrophorus electricus]
MENREQTEWGAVNRLLRRHGFGAVRFADPTENKNLADLVLLEKETSAELRATLSSMLADSERRQALIQELLQSNGRLKEEVEQQQVRATRHCQRAVELERTLAEVKVKVQSLEDSFISKAAQQHSQLEQQKQDKADAEKRCQSLQQQLSEQKEQLSQVQKKLHHAVTQEEKRISRQTRAFQRLQGRPPGPHSPSDQLILDVIDIYESQMQQLQNKLKSCQRKRSCENDSSDVQTTTQETNTDTSTSSLASSSYKALLKSYQEQLRKTKAQREDLKAEIQRLKQDLESRPTLKELKSCKRQLRQMDRLIQQSCVRPGQTPTAEESVVSSTEQQHITDCQTYLKEICLELKVCDVNHVVSAVKARCKEADATLALEKIISDITAILTNLRAPLGLLRQPVVGQGLRDHSQQWELEWILPTLEFWSQQLICLPDLHRSLGRLVKRLLPWQPEDTVSSQCESVKVEDLMLLVETLLEETLPGDGVLRSPTRHTLEAMVSHFQKLFDAPSLSGVYPRMNEVYTRLGEMTNAMRNLKDVLDMDERAPPSEVVNAVARIVSSAEAFSGQHLHDLLGTSDIDSIIVKLKEHEEFFPAFHTLVVELLQTLDAESLDDIVPVVKSLKSLAE